MNLQRQQKHNLPNNKERSWKSVFKVVCCWVFLIWKQTPVDLACAAPAVACAAPAESRAGRVRTKRSATSSLKTKLKQTQCASERDTEWTCGAFCADIDSAIYTSRIKNFLEYSRFIKKVFTVLVDIETVRVEFWPIFCDFRIDAIISSEETFRNKGLFCTFSQRAKLCSKIFGIIVGGVKNKIRRSWPSSWGTVCGHRTKTKKQRSLPTI